jgi:transcriptional regulator with XRE-family HTH domain
MSEVGLEVRRRREAMGWSQPKLAVEAGMAVSAVSQIETGKRAPSANSLSKLAEAFGVEIGDLFPKVEASLWSDDQPAERRDLGEWEAMYRAMAAKKRAEFVALEDSFAAGYGTPKDMAVLCEEVQSSYERGMVRFEGVSAGEKQAARVLDALDELGSVASDITYAYASLPEGSQIAHISQYRRNRKTSLRDAV